MIEIKYDTKECPLYIGNTCHALDKAYRVGKADAINPIMQGYNDLVKLKNLMTKYFCEVDLKTEKTDLEKLALKIASDGMQTMGWLVDYLEDFKIDK